MSFIRNRCHCWSLVQIGKGMLRVMAGDVKGCADIIPVDLAVNMIIAAAWSTAIER